jgi:hypothetical protein
MKNAVCTIITSDYLHYALALRDSIRETGFQDFHFYIFIAASKQDGVLNEMDEGTTCLFVDDLSKSEMGEAIYTKYFDADMDKYRWSMKSVLILHLLEEKGFGKVFCVDCDINFYSSPKFLFDELNSSAVLLTPHYRASDPGVDMENYVLSFTDGIFNAGFVGCNTSGLDAMKWWANSCLHICEKNAQKGQFVDQTHLNLLPVYFEGVHIVKHRGCNVANWNMLESKREVQADGTVKINDKYDVVFIHFTPTTIHGIQHGRDACMQPFLDAYERRNKKYFPEYTLPQRKKKAAVKPDQENRIVRKLKSWMKG